MKNKVFNILKCIAGMFVLISCDKSISHDESKVFVTLDEICDYKLVSCSKNPKMSIAEGLDADYCRVQEEYLNPNYYWSKDTLIMDFGSSSKLQEDLKVKIKDDQKFLNYNPFKNSNSDVLLEPYNLLDNINVFNVKIDSSEQEYVVKIELLFAIDVFYANRVFKGTVAINDCCKLIPADPVR